MGREQSEVDRPDARAPGWGEQLEFSGARKGGEGVRSQGFPAILRSWIPRLAIST